jgi:hypothetical protein
VEGVIAVIQARQRAWWRTPLDEGGGGSPPSCSSSNGIVGMGDNTLQGSTEVEHDCATCPWGQWKSARKGGEGKDCKEFARLFVFRPASRLPLIVTVPPTSLKAMQQYAMRLLDAGLEPFRVVTRLKLVKDKSGSGITYSKIAFEFAGALPNDEAERMRDVARILKSGLASRVISVEASDLTGSV